MLDHKKWIENCRISSSSQENETHLADRTFDKDSKICFFQGALVSGKERLQNLWEMGNNRDIYCYANQEVVNLE